MNINNISNVQILFKNKLLISSSLLITQIKLCCILNFILKSYLITKFSLFSENNENLVNQIRFFPSWHAMENSLFNISLNELSLIPEFFLAFTAIIAITHCSLIAYNKKYGSILLQFSVTSLSILILCLTLLLYLHEKDLTLKYLSFEFSFLNDSLGFLAKIITIGASLSCLYLLQDYIIEYNINNTEYDLLMLYAVLGLTLLITASDFGTIFLALELQSLSLYMLAGFKKNSVYSIESGLKYFILGALSAAYFLLGWSLLYGISGLFVLLSFHFFFFNLFSEVNSKVQKDFIEYKINNENEIEKNISDSWDNLFFSSNNDLYYIINLLSFTTNLKIISKLTELFCCVSSKHFHTEKESFLFADQIFKESKNIKNPIVYTKYNNPILVGFIVSKRDFVSSITEKSHRIQKKIDLYYEKKEFEIKPKKITENQFKHTTSKKTDESRLTESSLTLILISFFFKLAVAPFHLWALDIYEGSLTSSTIFFAVVTKFSVIVILIKIRYYGFYSSINNIGYILLALTISTLNVIKTTIFYLIIYISSSLATWSGLVSIQLQKNRYIKKQNKEFGDVILLRKTNPILALTLQIALFQLRDYCHLLDF